MFFLHFFHNWIQCPTQRYLLNPQEPKWLYCSLTTHQAVEIILVKSQREGSLNFIITVFLSCVSEQARCNRILPDSYNEDMDLELVKYDYSSFFVSCLNGQVIGVTR